MTENYYFEDEENKTATLFIASTVHGELAFVIDLDDLERVKQHKWCIQRCRNVHNGFDKFYAKASKGNMLLHRFVSNAKKGEVVDHINRNPFDNRKINLRNVNYSINNFNINKSRRNKSGATGVHFAKNCDKWLAHISKDGKQICLGYYSKFEDAVIARKNAEIEYYGETKS